MYRVVITGMGIYSVIGKNLTEVKESLYQGRSGIVFDPVRKEMGFRSALTVIWSGHSLKGSSTAECGSDCRYKGNMRICRQSKP